VDNFVVSARKYRPARFEDVIGQPQVTNTLKNAIRQHQLAQAFLFCGPRGVGKTTCARILAKVVNCDRMTEDMEACNECPSCLAFNENASLNVFELDAASNNSVDDIRELVNQVRFTPQAGKKKIYIIDEVHMLSSSAFNAFLKTLEEPPSYAIFILATTEKHKIIPTILSRCQIFDFKRIRTEDMAAHLQQIAAREHIEADGNALHLIAQKADGALRDALSIFDRISLFGGGHVGYQEVLDGLNLLDYDYYFRLVDGFLAEDTAASLMLFDEILNKGFDGDVFMSGLGDHLRNLLVCRHPETLSLLETADNINARYKEQAAYCPPSFLISALAILNDSEQQFRMARNKRLCTEMALLKLCHLQRTLQWNELPAEGSKKKLNPEAAPLPPAAKATAKQPDAVSDPEVNKTIPVTTVDAAPTQKPPKEPATPMPKSNGGIHLATLDSLVQEALQEEQAVQALPSGPEAPPEQIALPKFEEALAALMQHLHEKEKFTVENVLKLFPPELDEQYSVRMAVANPVQQDLLEGERDNLADFLREFLGLKRLLVYVQLDKTRVKTEGVQRIYSTADKYDYLVKKHPALEELKKRLRLELDF